MSDVEYLDVMLGSNSRNELESGSEDRIVEVDLGSDRQRQDAIQNSEDFRGVRTITTHSVEKCKKGNPLKFFTIRSLAKYQKKVNGGPLETKKFRNKNENWEF